MKKILFGLLATLGILAAVYALGPRPDAPKNHYEISGISTLPAVLEAQIRSEEAATPGLKKDCEARIVWADSTRKAKTPYALLYLHGFSASPAGEGDPVAFNLAKRFGGNLFMARMAGHGIDLGDSTMANLSTDEYLASAERALVVAKILGDTVLVVGTSAGGALALWLASQHPEIKAVVTYSPCIAIFDPNARLLDDPWGLQLARLITGKEFNDIQNPVEAQKKYWTTHYHLNGVQMLQNFLTHDMTAETFSRVKCPTLLLYFYKNEAVQDKVVSVPAMLTMYDELGTTAKRKVALPSTMRHEMASRFLSKDVASVERETVLFLEEVVGLSSAKK